MRSGRPVGSRKIPGQVFSGGVNPEIAEVKTPASVEEAESHLSSLAIGNTTFYLCQPGAEVTGWNEHQRVTWFGTRPSEAFSFG